MYQIAIGYLCDRHLFFNKTSLAFITLTPLDNLAKGRNTIICIGRLTCVVL